MTPDWQQIKEAVESNGNVHTVSMHELRDAAKKDKLGVHIRAEISKTLAGMGLGHLPQDLPSYQHQQVRLYKRGTPVGDLIELVLAPGEQNDRRLKEQLDETTVDYAAIIEQIRELVSE
ncbi:MAG: hypothetical protein F6K30_13195 [Cyanothece sp. SIO2G6]|nr:hypothetical protein [Cyanothece sp. SIO2G6]